MIESKVSGLDSKALERKAREKLESVTSRRRKRPVSGNRNFRQFSTDLIISAANVGELYQFEGELFVKQVFRNILGRDADSEALAHYLRELSDGCSKPEIIARLSLSKEGRTNASKIRGITTVRVRYLAGRLPVVSYLLETAWKILTLPRYVRHTRAKELQLYALILENNEFVNKLAKDYYQKAHFLEERIEDLAEIANLKLDGKDFALEKARLEAILQEKAGVSQLNEIVSNLDSAQTRLQREVNRIARIDTVPDAGPQTMSAESPPTVSPKLENFYVAFEDKFRGNEKAVAESFSDYLQYLEGFGKESCCLDIGCGRGEWLELLKDRNVGAKGIDLNATMAGECQAKGLDVEAIDLVSYLGKSAENSFDLISAFHVVEHLEFEVLICLFDEALRVLKPGGRIIFETPNPSNLQVGSHNFYLDPTHRNPLPSEMLRFVAQQRGYREVEILNLHPVKEIKDRDRLSEVELDVLDRLYGPQDYAVVAVK